MGILLHQTELARLPRTCLVPLTMSGFPVCTHVNPLCHPLPREENKVLSLQNKQMVGDLHKLGNGHKKYISSQNTIKSN